MTGIGAIRWALLGSTVAVAVSLSGCGRDGGSTEVADSSTAVATTPAATDDETDAAGSTSEDSAGTAAPDTAAIDDGATETEQLFPDVIGVKAEQGADGSWTFSVTLSSPYDSPSRYADAWRVVGPDGTVYGERILLHDHAGEQPFTRSQSGILIPGDVTEVVVEGRDQVSGWGGATMTVTLDPS